MTFFFFFIIFLDPDLLDLPLLTSESESASMASIIGVTLYPLVSSKPDDGADDGNIIY